MSKQRERAAETMVRLGLGLTRDERVKGQKERHCTVCRKRWSYNCNDTMKHKILAYTPTNQFRFDQSMLKIYLKLKSSGKKVRDMNRQREYQAKQKQGSTCDDNGDSG